MSLSKPDMVLLNEMIDGLKILEVFEKRNHYTIKVFDNGYCQVRRYNKLSDYLYEVVFDFDIHKESFPSIAFRFWMSFQYVQTIILV